MQRPMAGRTGVAAAQERCAAAAGFLGMGSGSCHLDTRRLKLELEWATPTAANTKFHTTTPIVAQTLQMHYRQNSKTFIILHAVHVLVI